MNLIINIFWLTILLTSTDSLPKNSDLSVAGDNCLFTYFQQTFTLHTNGVVYTYDQFEDAQVNNLSHYSCLLYGILYSDGQVLIMDNKLNVVKQIDLNNLAIYSGQILDLENANFLWIYDNYENKIYRLNINKLEAQFVSLNFITTNVKRIQYYDNKLYFLCDEGIFSIDYFFNIKKEYDLSGLDDFLLSEYGLFTVRNNELWLNDKQIRKFNLLLQICGIYHKKIIIKQDNQLKYMKINDL